MSQGHRKWLKVVWKKKKWQLTELGKILLSRKPELGLQFQIELGQVSQH